MRQIRYVVGESIYGLVPDHRSVTSATIYAALQELERWGALSFVHANPAEITITAEPIPDLGRYYAGRPSRIILDSDTTKLTWDQGFIFRVVIHEMLHHLGQGLHIDTRHPDEKNRPIKANYLHSGLGIGWYGSLGPDEADWLSRRYPGAIRVHPKVFEHRRMVKPLKVERDEWREQRDELRGVKGKKEDRQELNRRIREANETINESFRRMKHVVLAYGATHAKVAKWQS